MALGLADGSFWISRLGALGRWSPIYPPSLLIIEAKSLAVRRAHFHDVKSHKRGMTTL
jgi:uncharacterized membrane protein